MIEVTVEKTMWCDEPACFAQLDCQCSAEEEESYAQKRGWGIDWITLDTHKCPKHGKELRLKAIETGDLSD